VLIFITTYRSLQPTGHIVIQHTLERVRIDRFGKNIIVFLHTRYQVPSSSRSIRRREPLEGVLYFKGHLVYIKRDPILLQDPDRSPRPTDHIDDCGGPSRTATLAVVDRTDKTLKTGCIGIFPYNPVETPLDSTASIGPTGSIGPPRTTSSSS